MSKRNYRRKDKRRRTYTGSKRFDSSCRNHGSCPWCRGNRTIQALREHERRTEAGWGKWIREGGNHA